MTLHNGEAVLLEVTREGGIADNVRTTAVINNIGKVRCSFLHQMQPYTERKQTFILTDDKQMHQIIFAACLFHKVQVAECKRIGVHHNSGDFSRRNRFRELQMGELLVCFFFQVFKIIPEAGPPVFHKDNKTGDPRNLPEAKVIEKL